MLTTVPAAHSFVKNPIVFEITTNTYLTTAGVKHRSKIAFTAAPTVGPSVLAMTFNGISLLMNGVTIVDDSGDQYRFKTGIETFDVWLASFATALQNNYIIGSNYSISYDTVLDEVYLDALADGPEWDIAFTATPGTSVASSVTAGVTRIVKENFHVVLQLSIRNLAAVEVANIKLDMERISDTLFRMRVEGAIRKYVSPLVPALDTAGIFASEVNTAYFTIRYYEAYGNPIDEKYYYNGGSLYYLAFGGINETEYPTSTLLSGYLAQYKFLTWQKRSKSITKNQPEYLGWLHLSTDANPDVELKVVINYTDGTTLTDYSIYMAGAASFRVYYANTGYGILVDPIADGVKIVDFYTVQVCVKTTHAALSEIMTYHLLQEDTSNTRYFIFCNSLGWWDTLRTTGDQIRGVSVSIDVFEKFMLHNYAVKDGRFIVSDKEGQRTYKQNTGLMDSKSVVDYLAELLLNPAAYEIRNGKLIPIIITTADIKLSNDFATKDRFFIEFEYYEAYNFIGLKSITT